ncbi:MAG: metallophosphoesterase [Candidatus Pacebacteria bacterium]|nr:metallophosphoesterase [Candidatus Paceibacterota bacterium]
MTNSWNFIYAADMQPGSPKSYRFKPAYAENWRTARRQIMDRHPEFLLIGGDVTRDGYIHRWELEEMKADFDGMGIPYHVIPGNMDTGNKHTDRTSGRPDRNDVTLNMTSEELQTFESVFGPSSWTFDHRNVRVSGFCDMLLGSGLPQERELWDWLEKQANRPKSDHNIWLMHYALFLDAPDEPAFDITAPEHYLDWYFCVDQGSRDRLLDLLKKAGATRVITGHIHCRKEHVVDGIHFDLAPGIAMGQWFDRWPDGDASLGFLEYTVSGKRIEKRFVPLEHESTRTDGYGPGGHPLPEARDYSLAWETGGQS